MKPDDQYAEMPDTSITTKNPVIMGQAVENKQKSTLNFEQFKSFKKIKNIKDFYKISSCIGRGKLNLIINNCTRLAEFLTLIRCRRVRRSAEMFA